MLQYKLSATETAGVVGVGVVLGLISNQITGRFSGREHLTAMVVSGAALYTLGVVIGTNRPEGGFRPSMSALPSWRASCRSTPGV